MFRAQGVDPITTDLGWKGLAGQQNLGAFALDWQLRRVGWWVLWLSVSAVVWPWSSLIAVGGFGVD